jgi:hypothetical protein
LGALLAFYGNQPQDSFWSAYVPLLLLLFRYCPDYRFICLLATGLLWCNIAIHTHFSHRLPDNFDNRGVLLSAIIADIPRVDEIVSVCCWKTCKLNPTRQQCSAE